MPASENGPKQGGLLRPGVVQRAHPLANLSKKTIQDKALARCEPAHAAAVHREPLPPPATRAFPNTRRGAAARRRAGGPCRSSVNIQGAKKVSNRGGIFVENGQPVWRSSPR